MSKLLRVACLLALSLTPGFAQTPARPAAQPSVPAAIQAKPPVPAASPAKAPPAASPAKVPPAAAMAGSAAKIDINSATEAQLDSIPGIGPARAKGIVAGRPYAELDQLVTKKILSQGVFTGAKDRMALANINTSSEAELAKTLPGIGAVRAKAIVGGRPYATPQDLVTKGVLTQGVFDKSVALMAY